MKNRVKLYVEGCCDLVRLDIKIHKFFQGDGDYLEDAKMHIKNAEIAMEYNMLPSELKEKKLDEWLNIIGEDK